MGTAAPQVVLASNNAKKLAELQRIVGPLVPGLTVLGLSEVAAYAEPAETEATFAGNALIKARACVAATGLPALADDSGLCIDALNAMPGVLSARWSGTLGAARGVERDAANNELVLSQLADVPDERRTARFVCAIALCLPGSPAAQGPAPLPGSPAARTEFVEHGEMAGHILRAASGGGGFGYDPIFAATGHTVSTAELDPADKDRISHRGRALAAIAPHVAATLLPSSP